MEGLLAARAESELTGVLCAVTILFECHDGFKIVSGKLISLLGLSRLSRGLE